MVRLCFLLVFMFAKNLLFSHSQVLSYADLIASGDSLFRKQEYFFAFETYRKASRYSNDSPALHYRLGRIYGLLEPRKPLCEKEYIIAITLLFKEIADDTRLLNMHLFRQILGIPVDESVDEDNPSMNPIFFVKRDIDRDGKEEIFLLLKRGKYSYTLFVIDFFDEHLRANHLVTFFENPFTKDCLQWIDLNRDGREEIIVKTEINGYTSLFIFQKTWGELYLEIFHAPALCGSTQIFCDFLGDHRIEIEVNEKIPKKTILSGKDLLLTQKSVYKWDKKKYDLIDRRLVRDEAYVLNVFFRALLFENDFETAFQFIDTEMFFGNFFSNPNLETFKKYMRQPHYKSFLCETNFCNNPRQKIKICKDGRYNPFEGWEETSVSAPNIQASETHYKMMFAGKVYTLILVHKDVWKIKQWFLNKYHSKGWQIQ